MAAVTGTLTTDGQQDEGNGRVIWSPAADGRAPDGCIPLGSVISNPRFTYTRPPVTVLSAQTAAMLHSGREASDFAPVPEDLGFLVDPAPSSSAL